MKYKNLYKELAQILTDFRVSVCDHDLGGGYCFHTKPLRAFVVVKPELNYKDKYFVLAHEAGHLFYMKKGKKFNWSDKPRTEEEAHWFALQLLKFNDIDPYEYYRFYERVVKRAKKRRKSWFEI